MKHLSTSSSIFFHFIYSHKETNIFFPKIESENIAHILTKTHYYHSSHLGILGETPIKLNCKSLQALWRAPYSPLNARIVEHTSGFLAKHMAFIKSNMVYGKKKLPFDLRLYNKRICVYVEMIGDSEAVYNCLLFVVPSYSCLNSSLAHLTLIPVIK